MAMDWGIIGRGLAGAFTGYNEGVAAQNELRLKKAQEARRQALDDLQLQQGFQAMGAQQMAPGETQDDLFKRVQMSRLTGSPSAAIIGGPSLTAQRAVDREMYGDPTMATIGGQQVVIDPRQNEFSRTERLRESLAERAQGRAENLLLARQKFEAEQAAKRVVPRFRFDIDEKGRQYRTNEDTGERTLIASDMRQPFSSLDLFAKQSQDRIERDELASWRMFYNKFALPVHDKNGDIIEGTGLSHAEAMKKADEAIGGRPRLAPQDMPQSTTTGVPQVGNPRPSGKTKTYKINGKILTVPE